MKSNDEIITYLIEDLKELIPAKDNAEEELGGFHDYLLGVIERSQTVLRMMGVPELMIPTDGSC